ncbi:hypothetical protein CTI12_AA196840 [Artemisia annua]|uniref:Uncharacterized protein n=1 Tax=Artemisia annua TaxID=35608 RepID=A0A2U1P3U3_ARTAN|nr:hypothetical protein CTI12_AA196840 [Artemisia annua]
MPIALTKGSTRSLKKCIAEVTNTPWGERVQFLFNPNSDVVAKPLHVSPFMDMLGSWSLKTNSPGDNLLVTISVNHPKLGDYFTASLTANRVSSSSVQHAVFFWLMPHKVALWIYWHALKLLWKKVVFIQHPRYENSSYKEDALARDRSLGCCPAKKIVGLDGETLNGHGVDFDPHERRSPVHHSFKYNVRYAFIDLDHTIHPPPDHISAQQARDIAQTNGPVFLLTIPPSVGYHQNPLSVYYCYDVEGSSKSLKKCIAEATNSPWGERLQFLFNPNSDVVAKLLHDMLGNWKMRTSLPGDNLVVTISVHHPKLGDYFTASLSAKRVSSSSIQHAVFFWLMPHKISIWMCLQALKLWWKKLEVVPHPKYENLAYKEDALARNRNLGCCPVFATQTDNGQQVKQISQKERWIKWRDPKWPWC